MAAHLLRPSTPSSAGGATSSSRPPRTSSPTRWPAGSRTGSGGDQPVQVAGLPVLRRARRAGRGVAQPPIGRRPYVVVWLDALSVKVREQGRVVNTAALVATGVNASGHREILGLELGAAEDGASWTGFLRGLVARGLSGVKLVISDAHQGLVDAVASLLDGASWPRCPPISWATCWSRFLGTPSRWWPAWSARSSPTSAPRTPGPSSAGCGRAAAGRPLRCCRRSARAGGG
jgi:hypothetical protein